MRLERGCLQVDRRGEIQLNQIGPPSPVTPAPSAARIRAG
jgi:hypothetical protein